MHHHTSSWFKDGHTHTHHAFWACIFLRKHYLVNIGTNNCKKIIRKMKTEIEFAELCKIHRKQWSLHKQPKITWKEKLAQWRLIHVAALTLCKALADHVLFGVLVEYVVNVMKNTLHFIDSFCYVHCMSAFAAQRNKGNKNMKKRVSYILLSLRG